MASRRQKHRLSLAPVLLAIVALLVPQLTATAYQPTDPRVPASTSTPNGPFDPASHGVPDTIAGYRVLAVITPENTACVGPNETRLILQTNEPTEMDFLSRNDSSAAIQATAQLGLAARVDILWASSSTMQNQLVAEIQRWNEAIAARGCFQLSSVATGTDGTNLTTASPSPGFVIIEDTNAGLYTDDNGQQVTLVAPTIGGSQTQYVS